MATRAKKFEKVLDKIDPELGESTEQIREVVEKILERVEVERVEKGARWACRNLRLLGQILYLTGKDIMETADKRLADIRAGEAKARGNS